MEKATDIAVVPGDFGWYDVGSFAALPEVRPADARRERRARARARSWWTRRGAWWWGRAGRSGWWVSGTWWWWTPGTRCWCVPRDRSQDVRAVVQSLEGAEAWASSSEGDSMNAHIFREYDIRGLVDQDLTEEVVELLGRAWARYARAASGGQRIVVGRDCRESSHRASASALVAGITATGLDVLDVGVVPDAADLLRRQHPAGGRPGDDHRQPQPARVQRLQDRRRQDHPPRRTRSRRCASSSRPRDFEVGVPAGRRRSTSSRPTTHFVRQTMQLGRAGHAHRRSTPATAPAARWRCRSSGAWASTWCRSYCEMDGALPQPPPGPDGAEANLADLHRPR